MMDSLKHLSIEGWCLFHPEIWDALAGLPVLEAIDAQETDTVSTIFQRPEGGIRFNDNRFSSLSSFIQQGFFPTFLSLFESAIPSTLIDVELVLLDSALINIMPLLRLFTQHEPISVFVCTVSSDSFVLRADILDEIARWTNLTLLHIRTEQQLALSDER